MDIPWQNLDPDTLRALIEEFVTRGGTDYGDKEISLETRVRQVQELLRTGKAKIVFDPETESCDIQEKS
ncbi:MAG: YheU family protein [Bdellovibrionia bacterium]